VSRYKQVLLDATELEHPEPLESSVAIIGTLKRGEYLHLITKRRPVPLLQICESNGFAFAEHVESNSKYHTLVATDSSIEVENIDV